jgi:hypothetical protein
MNAHAHLLLPVLVWRFPLAMVDNVPHSLHKFGYTVMARCRNRVMGALGMDEPSDEKIKEFLLRQVGTREAKDLDI